MAKNKMEETSDMDGVEDSDFAEEDFAEDGWEEEAGESGDAGNDDAPAPPKKKSSKFNLILILCAVLGGGGFIYSKLGGGGAPAPAPPVAIEQPAAQDQDTVAATLPQAPAEEKKDDFAGGFLKNPETFDKVEEIRENLQLDDYVDGEDSEQWAVEGGKPGSAPVVAATGGSSADKVLSAADQQQPLTPLPAPAAMDALPPMPGPEVKQPAVAPPALPKAQDIMIPPAVPAAASEQPAVPEQVEEAASGGDDLKKSIDSVSQQLSNLSTRLDDLENAVESLEIPSVSSKEIGELKASLTKLEKKVGGLSTVPASVTRSADSESRPVSKPRPPVSDAPVVPQQKAVLPAGWTLKSAQPGKAIVGKPGLEETYTVTVGDRLEGIGKITAIEQQGGLWVVQGVAGKITQ